LGNAAGRAKHARGTADAFLKNLGRPHLRHIAVHLTQPVHSTGTHRSLTAGCKITVNPTQNDPGHLWWRSVRQRRLEKPVERESGVGCPEHGARSQQPGEKCGEHPERRLRAFQGRNPVPDRELLES